MIDLKYSEILRLNKIFGESMQGDIYGVTMLSNIIISQSTDIFEYGLRTDGINAHVKSGDYDNIVQDSLKYNKSDLIIIFWEAANLVDGLQYKANVMNESEMELLIQKVCSEIDFVLSNLQATPLIIFNKFTSLIFNHTNIKADNFDRLCKKLNDYLETKAGRNVLLIDLDKIYAKLSISKSIDIRYYYSSKALYTIDFYKAYVQHIAPVVRSVNGKAKKALIFDCDNTLWKGIIGEDGMEGIEMSGKNKSGVVFEEVQNLAISLSRKGVIIALCSKNNDADVLNVLNNHPDISIKQENITIRKINWNDKPSNIKEIADELNIGVDSLVFVDDSDFELDYVKNQLPLVNTLKVPTNLFEYPKMIRDNLSLFYTISESEEDLKRTEMYKKQVERIQEKNSFEDIDSYLRSLDLKLTIYENPKAIIPRLSQLTQKTNQFNLTTKRYTEADISLFVESNSHVILAFKVEDKHGDSGITGLSIIDINKEEKTGNIDTLLMSCRVLGRSIEIAFISFIIGYLQRQGIEQISASYIRTFKNEQVSDFYEKAGFKLVLDGDENKRYELRIDDYVDPDINYIKIIYDTEN